MYLLTLSAVCFHSNKIIEQSFVKMDSLFLSYSQVLELTFFKKVLGNLTLLIHYGIYKNVKEMMYCIPGYVASYKRPKTC